jgi:hypothetical protein
MGDAGTQTPSTLLAKPSSRPNAAPKVMLPMRLSIILVGPMVNSLLRLRYTMVPSCLHSSQPAYSRRWWFMLSSSYRTCGVLCEQHNSSAIHGGTETASRVAHLAWWIMPSSASSCKQVALFTVCEKGSW